MENSDEIEDLDNFHQIQNKYTFWYRVVGNTKAGVNYNESIKKIATFQTVEHFWRIYDYLKRPKDLHYTEYHLFKEGITPTWEDPQNKMGGKWMIRLKKGIASRYWEDIILAIIGEQFDVGSEVCGAVLSVRSNEDIVSIWNKSADNLEAVNKIRDQLRRLLRLPALIAIEYKRHQDSLQDKSSYRNPTMVWRAPSRQLNNAANNGEKPHYNNSYNRAHDGTANPAAGGSGYVKQAWKPNRTEDSTGASGTGATGGYRSGGSAWNKPARDDAAHHQNNQDSAPRQGGWTRGQTAPVPAPAAATTASAAPSAGVSSATAGLQAALGIKAPAPAAKPAPAVPAAAPASNPWTKKSPVI